MREGVCPQGYEATGSVLSIVVVGLVETRSLSLPLLTSQRKVLDISLIQAYLHAVAISQAWVLKLSCMLT